MFPFQPNSPQEGEQKDSGIHDRDTIRVPSKTDNPSINDDETQRPKSDRPTTDFDNETKRIPKHPAGTSSPNMTPLPDDMEDPEGSFRIGPYLVYNELARGGMGSVYDGIDPVLNRRVAIKIMDAKLIHDQEAVRRFQREARATASIDHENIARIYMVGMSEGGAPFISMEFIEGGTMEHLIAYPEGLTFSNVADLMIQVCHGLQAALKKKIIHRDIKPANIMLTKLNQVKIVDFGLAKFFQEESLRTVAGMVMGTPRYMSPEQAQGAEVDFRSDIYSLGATFYHLLAGKSPFDGENPTQIMLKQVSAPLVPMRQSNPDIPLEFEDIITQCMKKDREERYQEYDDLVNDLNRIKLQFRSREEGSFVNQPSLAPSAGLDTRGNPLPPQDTVQPANARSSSSYSQPLPDPVYTSNTIEEEENLPVPIWRWVAIGASIFFAVVLIVTIIIKSVTSEPEPAPVAQNASGEKTGLQVVLEAIIRASNEDANTSNIPRINQDYVAWKATEKILYNLQDGVEDYHVINGEYPSRARDLVRENIVFQNFDLGVGDTPLDGWGNPIDYLSGSKTLTSAGIDERLNTEDDLILSLDEFIYVRTEDGQLLYDDLETEEEERQETIKGSS